MRRYAVVAALLVLIASIRIAATYTALSHTMDEPIHLGGGMEWLAAGSYQWDPSHPPLVRVISAAAVSLDGARLQPADSAMREGLLLLGHDAQYDRMLAVARLGVLPFFWIASAAVFLWAWREAGGVAALAAILIFTTIPPVLAHAGLVTTDMAATAFCALTAVMSLAWAARPSPVRTVFLGILLGLGTLSKFSYPIYVPAIWLLWVAWRRPALKQVRTYARPALIAALIACFVVWAGYRFSVGPLLEGLRLLMVHNTEGHASYILGQRHQIGVWYFFPITLLVKTPLPLLLLLLSCVGLLAYTRRAQARPRNAGLRPALFPTLYCLAILLIAMSARINIGVRHVLPIYAGLAVIGGITVARLLPTRARYLLLPLLAWQIVSGASHAPDYLSYTNEITRNHAEDFVAESDLDWGQDMHRVGDFLRHMGAREVSFTPYNITYLEAGHAFPKCTFSDWYRPAPGWNVVSLSGLKVFNHPGWVGGRAPQFRIGRTHWAWYFPPNR